MSIIFFSMTLAIGYLIYNLLRNKIFNWSNQTTGVVICFSLNPNRYTIYIMCYYYFHHEQEKSLRFIQELLGLKTT